MLADFRAWLQEAANTGAGQFSPSPLGEEGMGVRGTPAPPDLHTLLGQMAALRHEVNLQTKATRAQQEQNTEALGELRRALDTLTKPAAPAAEDDALRGVLKVLIDIADAAWRVANSRGRTAIDAVAGGGGAPRPSFSTISVAPALSATAEPARSRPCSTVSSPAIR